jgi:hypothetical protein
VRDVAPPAKGTVVQSLSLRWAVTSENVTSTARASLNGLSVSRRLNIADCPEGLDGDSLQAAKLSVRAKTKIVMRRMAISSPRGEQSAFQLVSFELNRSIERVSRS